MSRRGSDHAPNTQRRPSNQRPPPQAYHEDSYQRSSSHELSDDEIPYMRANRHVRVPGLTPHHDPYRYVPSSSSQYPMTFTVLGYAGSDVGREPHDDLLARRRIREARARPNTEGRNPSWPFREPAEPAMFTPASARVCTYPMDIEIAPGPPAHIQDHRERDAHPCANEPQAVTSDNPLGSPSRISRPLHDRHSTQGNSVRTDPQLQQPRQRLPAHSGPSTIKDNRSKRPQYDD